MGILNIKFNKILIFITDRLYFVAFKKNFKPKNTATSHYFSIDDDFIYENFYNDFGPLNICMLYRYCQKLNAKLNNKTLANKKIVHYTSMNPAKRVNAAYLIGAFSVSFRFFPPIPVTNNIRLLFCFNFR